MQVSCKPLFFKSNTVPIRIRSNTMITPEFRLTLYYTQYTLPAGLFMSGAVEDAFGSGAHQRLMQILLSLHIHVGGFHYLGTF